MASCVNLLSGGNPIEGICTRQGNAALYSLKLRLPGIIKPLSVDEVFLSKKRKNWPSDSKDSGGNPNWRF